ncbi:hypothetical protein [Alteromonas sp. AMM-1]|uniref:hypothetical protein n=1 Tax=Alteromonas sp. AMM-1 TaxID=3394233 RepID=UPI0039A75CCE
MIEAANSKDLELLVSLEKVLLRSIIQNKPLDSDIQFRRNSKQFQKLLGGLSPNLIRSLPTETKIAIYCAVISTISTICDIAGIFDKEPKVIHQHFHENIHNFYDVPLKDIVKQRNKILKQRLQNPKKGNDSRNSA